MNDESDESFRSAKDGLIPIFATQNADGKVRKKPGPPKGSPKVPGSGRRKGSKNLKDRLMERAMAEAAANNASPMDVFLGMMRSPLLDPRTRLQAGKFAADFMCPKPGKDAPDAAATARLTIEGAAALEWTEREEQRMRFLRGNSYTPGLTDAEKRELDALECRNHAVEIERDLAGKTPAQIDARDREGAKIFGVTVEEMRADREAILSRAREPPTK
jgi:hypothetical protein